MKKFGPRRVLSIFLAGSVAKDEVAACTIDGCLEIYSDVDLFVVVEEGVDVDTVKSHAMGLWSGPTFEEAGYRMLAAPDVGVYTLSDLLAQKPRPGTVDLFSTHQLIDGDPEIPRRTQPLSETPMPPEEALYLLENRLLENEAARESYLDLSDSMRDRYWRYVTLKGGVDAVTAVLLAFGRYTPLRSSRWEKFVGDEFRDRRTEILPMGDVTCVERCHAGLKALNESMAMPRRDFDGLQSQVERLLVDVWVRIARRQAPAKTVRWDHLITWRCRGTSALRNMRELLVLCRRLGVPRGGAVREIRRLAGVSSVDALRLSGLMETVGRVDSQASAELTRFHELLERLTQVLGEADGPPLARARRLCRSIR